ncbi:MAG: cell division topological specificity factor MinE, partial [Chromatiales bacterium]
IRKYVHVDQTDVSVTLDREDDCEILALNVVLPEHEPPRDLKRA